MKKYIFLIFLYMLTLSGSLYSKNMNLYEFNFVDIDGKNVKLDTFTGKPILLVNTASRCGFTPQYEDLQNLFVEFRHSDLTIIAITSNSFNQEYEDPEDIKKICLVNYSTGFITSSPIFVKGDNAHPMFKWIKNEYNKSPKWNFYKFLFDRNGKLVESWSSMIKPDTDKIKNKINSLI